MSKRKPCKEDRRRVHVYLTDKGSEILEEASKAMESMFENPQNISVEEATLLNELLDLFRG